MPPVRIETLAEVMPEAHAELQRTAATLEARYRDMQDIEFTIEDGKLWLLQTRDGKRTAAGRRPDRRRPRQRGPHHPRRTRCGGSPRARSTSSSTRSSPPQPVSRRPMTGRLIATGLNVSPGAAVGVAAFDPDTAQRLAGDGRKVILVRPETKPDDVHGMLAAEGILTTRGGRTSHAALVARQFGKPAVVGVSALEVDLVGHRATVGDLVIEEGDWVSLDGSTGEVFLGQLDTFVPDITDTWLAMLLSWADDVPAPGRPRQRRLPAGRPAGPGRTAPRASACAAPSTCSSSPSGCRSCSG